MILHALGKPAYIGNAFKMELQNFVSGQITESMIRNLHQWDENRKSISDNREWFLRASGIQELVGKEEDKRCVDL